MKLLIALLCLLSFGLFAQPASAIGPWVLTCSSGVSPLCLDGASQMSVFPQPEQTISFSYSALSLGLPQLTAAAVSGVSVGDFVECTPSGSVTSGLILGRCYVSSSGNVSIVLSTGLSLGLGSGSVSLNIVDWH